MLWACVALPPWTFGFVAAVGTIFTKRASSAVSRVQPVGMLAFVEGHAQITPDGTVTVLPLFINHAIAGIVYIVTTSGGEIKAKLEAKK